MNSAINDPIWIDHKIGDVYSMINIGGKKDDGKWKIVYYPLFGTYKPTGEYFMDKPVSEYVAFEEPRALVEKPMKDGTDFREVPLRYLTKIK